ncbi:hypothetical protein THAOC_10759 [Thalassiosira oceanica]|uniref:Uncharacterized protein n=1 Tax=Thalassiosira oceanica TaxID=159749 RepID=K0SP37_THAOC|nr:hypothetical protein THAOC_10759 [Thalassiosira oceanica]|eukprot:EJK68098.1 hypothetical protein THAOC_10759 [Thalassiosira oceanica]
MKEKPQPVKLPVVDRHHPAEGQSTRFHGLRRLVMTQWVGGQKAIFRGPRPYFVYQNQNQTPDEESGPEERRAAVEEQGEEEEERGSGRHPPTLGAAPGATARAAVRYLVAYNSIAVQNPRVEFHTSALRRGFTATGTDGTANAGVMWAWTVGGHATVEGPTVHRGKQGSTVTR